jgi:hypothetical protein
MKYIYSMPPGHRTSNLAIGGDKIKGIFENTRLIPFPPSFRKRYPDLAVLQDALINLYGTDAESHFDPEIHTLAALEAGISGHVPVTAHLVDVEDDDLPSDRYFRNAWEWSD